jgi:hypothetical protein
MATKQDVDWAVRNGYEQAGRVDGIALADKENAVARRRHGESLGSIVGPAPPEPSADALMTADLGERDLISLWPPGSAVNRIVYACILFDLVRDRFRGCLTERDCYQDRRGLLVILGETHVVSGTHGDMLIDSYQPLEWYSKTAAVTLTKALRAKQRAEQFPKVGPNAIDDLERRLAALENGK